MKKPLDLDSLVYFLKALVKDVELTIPAGVTSYSYSDTWITANTTCYSHNLEEKGVFLNVSWAFSAGKVTFTLSKALSSSLTFKFGMLKHGKV